MEAPHAATEDPRLFGGFILALAALPTPAVERVLTLDPQRTSVEFLLDATAHTVEGTVALVSGEIRFDPQTGAAAGEVRLDLQSAQTGNARRDRTMHEKVLESAKYPVAVFLPRRFSGKLADQGPSSLTLEGVLQFHGADHPLKLPAEVRLAGTEVSATAALSIPYVEWGLEDPSMLFLRVAKVVRVQVEAHGALR